MPGRKPILAPELPQVYAALATFPLRDQTLVTLGLNTGFRVTELLSLNVGHAWEGDHVRSHIRVTRAKLKGGKGRRRKMITSRTAPLNETASLILQKYLFARYGSGPMKLEEPLFPSRMHGNLRIILVDDDTPELRLTLARGHIRPMKRNIPTKGPTGNSTSVWMPVDGFSTIRVPFNRRFNNAVRETITNIEWDAEYRRWTFATSQAERIAEIVAKYFKVDDLRVRGA